MAIKRWPETGTLFYFGTPSQNSTGYWTNGTLVTIHVHCQIQENKAGFVIGSGGDSVRYGYNVICEQITTVFGIDTKLKFAFNGASYPVLQIRNHQNTKTTEMKI